MYICNTHNTITSVKNVRLSLQRLINIIYCETHRNLLIICFDIKYHVIMSEHRLLIQQS